jgi:hypothetical protein
LPAVIFIIQNLRKSSNFRQKFVSVLRQRVHGDSESAISAAIDIQDLACQILIFLKKKFRERRVVASEMRRLWELYGVWRGYAEIIGVFLDLYDFWL